MSKRHESEDEDNPEPFQSSGEEWDAEKEEAGRRKSSRLSGKPKRKIVESGSDESEGSHSSSDDNKRRKKNFTKKTPVVKAKRAKNEDEEEEEEEDDDEFKESASNQSATDSDSSKNSKNTTTKKNVMVVTNSQTRGIQRKFIPKTIYSEDYATGSFVILKKDAQGVDPSKHPSIWRIDGKALLQKYEAIDEDGKVRHKNTSIYTGWSTLDKDLYAPITVDVIKHNNNNLTVELHWDKLKVLNVDSD